MSRKLPVINWLRLQYAVSEEIMTLAEDKRPETNLFNSESQYASPLTDGVIIYIGGVLVGRQLNLGRNCCIPTLWLGMNIISISTEWLGVARCFNC